MKPFLCADFFLSLFYEPEDGNNIVFRNVDQLLPEYKTIYHRRLVFELHILQSPQFRPIYFPEEIYTNSPSAHTAVCPSNDIPDRTSEGILYTCIFRHKIA
jgi:hypothetical protein